MLLVPVPTLGLGTDVGAGTAKKLVFDLPPLYFMYRKSLMANGAPILPFTWEKYTKICLRAL